MKYLKNPSRFPNHMFVLPIISSVIIPIVIADAWIEIYHRIAFPLCKIPYVKRSKYIKVDRHKLKYLTFLQKIYCAYCGYGNGVIRYWGEIVNLTEQYWCGVHHKKSDKFVTPKHHEKFAEYGDEEDCKLKYGSLK